MYEIIENIIICIMAIVPGILWSMKDDLQLKIIEWIEEYNNGLN